MLTFQIVVDIGVACNKYYIYIYIHMYIYDDAGCGHVKTKIGPITFEYSYWQFCTHKKTHSEYLCCM